MGEVLGVCSKPQALGNAGAAPGCGLSRAVPGKSHSPAPPKEFQHFLLQLRISPAAPRRREGSISNDSLVILAAHLGVQSAIIAGIHSLLVQLRSEG